MKSNLFLSWPILFLLTAVIFTVFVWRQSNSMEEIYRDQMGFELQARVHLLSSVAAWCGERGEWQELKRFFVNQGNASHARFTLIDPRGNVVADSLEKDLDNHLSRPEIADAFRYTGKRPKYFHSIRYSDTSDQKFFYCATPVMLKGERYVLRVAVSIQEMDTVMAMARQDIIWTVVVTLLLSAGISYFLFQTVSRPARALCDASAKIAAGDYSTTLPVPDQGVIRELGNSVSRMAEELKFRIGQISREKSERDAIFAALAEGVVVIDFERNIVDINEAAMKMFQFQAIPPVLPGEETEIEDIIRQLKAGSETVEREITTVSIPDESKKLRVRGSVVCWGDNLTCGILLVFYDLTQLRRLESFRRDFIADVSHEIKTPLTVIRGAIETLRDGAINEPESAERFMEIIEMHSERLNSLVLDILRLNRLESCEARSQYVLVPGGLRHAVKIAMRYMQPRADSAGIRIAAEFDADPLVLLDEALIEQAVCNLIDNAIRHSGESDEIALKLFVKDGNAVIEVTDHGCGIAPEHQARIFERFFRVNKSRSRKDGGTGLGLAIVKHSVQIHGGTVGVRSTPGEGATFWLRIPLHHISFPDPAEG